MSVRYGKLPSEIKDRRLDDLQFDILVASVGIEQDNKDQKKAHDAAKSAAKRRK